MARTPSPPSDGDMLDAIELLKQDHRTVEQLFQQFENTSEATAKAEIAQQICLELTVHATVEEELFYPAVKGVIDDEIYHEAHVEHDGAKVLIAEIMASDSSDAFYEAKVKVLSEEIKHHVKEEEQRNGMFAQARRGDVDLDELGQRMMQRKQELTQTFLEDGIPPPQTRAMKGVQLHVGQPFS